MKPAEELQQVRAGLWFWQAYDPAVKTDLSSCAVLLPAGLVLIDPIPIADAALCRLWDLSKPVAIILTNANHERAAHSLRQRFDIPLFAHGEGQPEIAIPLDHVVDEGDLLFGALQVVTLPGFAPGEIALADSTARALHLGDALINIGAHGFAPLPAKYCADAKRARHSLQKLLQFDFELMTFAHGLPIVSGAKAGLKNLLA